MPTAKRRRQYSAADARGFPRCAYSRAPMSRRDDPKERPQCMRRAVAGVYCRQHAKIAALSPDRCHVDGCSYTAARIGGCTSCAKPEG
jgi:hypothetical protein